MISRTPNVNYFGTSFDGSPFAMIDPCVLTLTANQLGTDDNVWGKVVEIGCVKPCAGTVTATVEMPT